MCSMSICFTVLSYNIVSCANIFVFFLLFVEMFPRVDDKHEFRSVRVTEMNDIDYRGNSNKQMAEVPGVRYDGMYMVYMGIKQI